MQVCQLSVNSFFRSSLKLPICISFLPPFLGPFLPSFLSRLFSISVFLSACVSFFHSYFAVVRIPSFFPQAKIIRPQIRIVYYSCLLATLWENIDRPSPPYQLPDLSSACASIFSKGQEFSVLSVHLWVCLSSCCSHDIMGWPTKHSQQ